MTSAARLIDDYFWNVKEYDEWDQRFYVGNDDDAQKRDRMKSQHELDAKNAHLQLSMLWGRVVFVDGVAYKIQGQADDWKKLIVEEERKVVV